MGGVTKVIFYTDEQIAAETVAVPNVIGKTATAANISIVNAGLNVTFEGVTDLVGSGDAIVTAQYPAAGTAVERGSVIRIELRYIKETE